LKLDNITIVISKYPAERAGCCLSLAYSITSLYGWDFKLLAGAKLLEFHKNLPPGLSHKKRQMYNMPYYLLVAMRGGFAAFNMLLEEGMRS
jgi:hypothetical protein